MNQQPSAQGQCVDLPPFFDATNYTYWKTRMEIFLKSKSIQVWKRIENGPFIPLKKVEVPKEPGEWTAEDEQKIEVNYKAVNYLLYTVNDEEFKKLSRSQNTKEMWGKLKITHEGTNEVKKTRTDSLEEEFYNFKMLDDETMEEMFNRLAIITHELHLMGVVYSHEKNVCKVLKNFSGP